MRFWGFSCRFLSSDFAKTSQRHEVRGGVLAGRADEVWRERFALVDVAADCADEALFLFLRGGLWLDVLLVEAVGDGRNIRENFAVGNVRDEERVSSEVNGGDDARTDECVRFFRKVNQSVCRAFE